MPVGQRGKIAQVEHILDLDRLADHARDLFGIHLEYLVHARADRTMPHDCCFYHLCILHLILICFLPHSAQLARRKMPRSFGRQDLYFADSFQRFRAVHQFFNRIFHPTCARSDRNRRLPAHRDGLVNRQQVCA